MQTRRDQLQAYRFQNRRALAALVTGEPNVLEPPMRRLTVTTLSGIMIAILIAAGFALVGVFRPSAGSSWKNPGAVIVDQDTSAIYVYIDNTLHPVLNYTSAVLAVSSTGSVTRVSVSSSDISGATYGPEIGISDVPSALPPSSALIDFPMSVCSTERRGPKGSTQAVAGVTLHIGTQPGGRSVPSSQGVVVAAASNPGQQYLLTGGQRLPITTQVAGSLGLDTAAVPVGSAFLKAVPLGPALSPPRIPGAGTLTSYSVAGARQPIGRLVETTDTGSTYLVLAGGLALVTPVEKAILSSNLRPLRVSTYGEGRPPILRDRPPVLQPLETLPPHAPTIDESATNREGVCVVYTTNGAPHFTVPPGAALPDYLRTTVRESRTSLAGNADVVDVPATHAVLARPADGASTLLVIGDQGKKYPFTSNDLLDSFGYKDVPPTRVPPQLLGLIPYGGPLSPSSALRPVTR